MQHAPKSLPALTGLRGIAAFWVLFHHTCASVNFPPLTLTLLGHTLSFNHLRAGWLGVDIFFVLSGCVLFLPFIPYISRQAPRPSFITYSLRRITRILPAYYLQLCILFLLGSYGFISTTISTRSLLNHAAMLQTLLQSTQELILGVYWSLPVELHFYILLPLLVLIIKRIGMIPTGIGILVSTYCFRYYTMVAHAHDEIFPKLVALDQLFGRLDSFFIGMSVAYLYARFYKHPLASPHAFGLCILGIGGMFLVNHIIAHSIGTQAFWNNHLFIVFYRTCICASIGLLIYGLLSADTLFSRLCSHRALLYFGEISYGIYLWHYPLQQWLFLDTHSLLYVGDAYGLSARLCITLCLSIIVTSSSYYLLELPLMKRAKRVNLATHNNIV